MKELKVSAIDNGTVIDHIPAEKTFVVAEILDLSGIGNIISIATNLASSKLGKKGIIKVGSKILSEEETNKIALFAPQATINIVKNFEVVEKRKVSLPQEIRGIVKCFNPNCITNVEEVTTLFRVVKEEPLQIRCHYCERLMGSEQIVLL